MGQQDILDWLAANPGWHKSKEVLAGLGKRRTGGYFRLLKVLRETNEISFRLLSGNGKGYQIYEYKSKSLNTKDVK